MDKAMPIKLTASLRWGQVGLWVIKVTKICVCVSHKSKLQSINPY